MLHLLLYVVKRQLRCCYYVSRDGTDRQTDGRTDTRQMHRRCSAYYAGRASKIQGSCYDHKSAGIRRYTTDAWLPNEDDILSPAGGWRTRSVPSDNIVMACIRSSSQSDVIAAASVWHVRPACSSSQRYWPLTETETSLPQNQTERETETDRQRGTVVWLEFEAPEELKQPNLPSGISGGAYCPLLSKILCSGVMPKQGGYRTIRYDTRCYFNVRSKADMSRLNLRNSVLSRAFQFGQKSFDSIRFGNLINLPLVHWYSSSKLGVIFIVCTA